MILCVGILEDPVICYFMDFCKEMNRDFAFVNLKHLGKTLFLDDEHWYFEQYPPIAHNEIVGVYNRALFGLPKGDVVKRNLVLQLFYLMDFVYPNVLNRPKDTMSNLSKPYQLTMAHPYLSWHIPKSWMVANATIKLANPCIIKSISSERSIVNESFHDQTKTIYEPVLIQEYLKGLNIRLHICHQTLIATAIYSNEIDYRYSDSGNYFKEYKLPQNILDDAFKLSQALGLKLCGMDLIYARGRYFFLEANPSPGYSYFEMNLGHKHFSKSILNYIEDNNDYISCRRKPFSRCLLSASNAN